MLSGRAKAFVRHTNRKDFRIEDCEKPNGTEEARSKGKTAFEILLEYSTDSGFSL
jgi:hypothetical protein